MDNAKLDVTSEGNEQLATALSLAFGKYRTAVGYAIRPAREGKRYPVAEDRPRDAYMMGWEHSPKPLRLVFFWVKSDSPDYVTLPFKMDAVGAADFAARWLAEVDYGKGPDHDGDNGKGWRVYNEAWGHVDNQYQAFVAVAPSWAMYGK